MLFVPGLAVAADGFSTANVNMRSGPSTRYPAVAVIPLDTELEIHGCLADVPWCDVSFYRGRGWVAAQYIATDYRQNRVYLQPRYYRPLGIPTITFNLGNYWERNYRNRDFYRDRERWGRSDNDGNRRERRRNSDQYDNGYGQNDDNRPRRDYGNNDDNGYRQDGNRRDRDRRRVIEENNSVDQFENENDNRRRSDRRREEIRPEEALPDVLQEDNFRAERRRDRDRGRNAVCPEGDPACAIEQPN